MARLAVSHGINDLLLCSYLSVKAKVATLAKINFGTAVSASS